MSNYIYSCSRAKKELGQLVELLGSAELLQTQPDLGLIHQCVQPCDPCRRDHGVKHCKGWIIFVERGVLSFGPIPTPGQSSIRLDISACSSYRRSQRARQPEWDARPLASSVATLEIFSVEDETLLERHHMDLANRNQAGSAWHLQYGGNPACGVPPQSTSWLDEPRWPMPPLDLTLLIEVISYNFFPAEWQKLNEQGEWLRLIRSAEQLVVSHFAKHMWEHFKRAANDRDRTWLAAQDNAEFDPRPI